MKERPILFSSDMVRAILDGRKTQTRRIIKKQPKQQLFHCGSGKKYWAYDPHDLKAEYFHQNYGEIGDILWVRETWVIHNRSKFRFYLTYQSGDLWIKYKADAVENYETGEKILWKPSIFMPKHASRIKLEITNIRVERLQGISEEDAKAEGVYFYGWDDYHQIDYKNYSYNDKGMGDDWGVQTAKKSFETLWESINGKGSWDLNPWVWVIQFKRIKP